MKYEIPKDWLEFCDFKKTSPDRESYCCGDDSPDAEIILLSEIEPPQRDPEIPPFKKYKMVPILMTLKNPEGYLPPIIIERHQNDSNFKYKVQNGFHRYYFSIFAGYSKIPAIIRD